MPLQSCNVLLSSRFQNFARSKRVSPSVGALDECFAERPKAEASAQPRPCRKSPWIEIDRCGSVSSAQMLGLVDADVSFDYAVASFTCMRAYSREYFRASAVFSRADNIFPAIWKNIFSSSRR